MSAPAEEREPDPLLGTMLQDKYRVVRKLGQGGMGMVYEGEHTLIGRRVAIKTLLPKYATDPEVVTRFRREAQAATAIGHEHIVEVTDLGTLDDGGIFLVLEYLEGSDLGDLIAREGPQPVGRIVHIVCQLCEALSAAHAKGIVHRDLKPDNVYLIRRGGDPCFVKVLDFGISKIRDAEDGVSMTRTGTPVGTPLFMAPEQARGQKDVDHRVDVYALGVILYVALTGRYPFEDESIAALLVKILADPVPDVHALRPDLPYPLAGLIHRMLAKDRETRPADCAEVARALRPYRDAGAAGPGPRAAPVDALAATHTPSSRSGVRVGQPSSPPKEGAPRARIAAGATGVSGLEATVASAPDAAPSSSDAPAVDGPPSEASAPRAGSAPGLPHRSALPWAIGAAAVLSVAGAGLAWAALGSGSAAPTDAVEAAPAVEPVEDERATDEGLPAGAAPPATEVTVRIEVEPEDAELRLDGRRVGSPWRATVPANDQPRHVEVRHPGYETVERELVFDRPMDLTIALEPTGRGRRRGRRPGAPTRRSATRPGTAADEGGEPDSPRASSGRASPVSHPSSPASGTGSSDSDTPGTGSSGSGSSGSGSSGSGSSGSGSSGSGPSGSGPSGSGPSGSGPSGSGSSGTGGSGEAIVPNLPQVRDPF
ncbi:MAG TPA: protein kinase [Sandaracinaceae bacterium LLY-WYZ-13_1]|nr:protein kinase [Sandaracinaceae bacterium LLY-WYZ-13_1]